MGAGCGVGGGGAGGGAGVGSGCGPGQRLNLLLTAPPWRGETWADRLPPLLEPMGVSAVRAQTARAAERVIRTVPIHIAVVDLTLPMDDADPTQAEEAGTRILDLLARLASPPPTVVIQSPRGQRDAARSMHTALRCGAFAVVDRTAADLELMLGIMQRCLTRFYAGQWPGSAGPVPGLQPPRSGIY
jgi:hypothetical protein